MCCSRTQHSDAGEVRNPQPLDLESSTLPMSHKLRWRVDWALCMLLKDLKEETISKMMGVESTKPYLRGRVEGKAKNA